jgi:hypothetical protein
VFRWFILGLNTPNIIRTHIKNKSGIIKYPEELDFEKK